MVRVGDTFFGEGPGVKILMVVLGEESRHFFSSFSSTSTNWVNVYRVEIKNGKIEYCKTIRYFVSSLLDSFTKI